MRRARLLAAAALAAGCNQAAAPPPPPAPVPGAVRPSVLEWEPAEPAAFARAHTEHRGVVVLACAKWAAQCPALERVLAQPDVRRALGGWIAVEVDLTDESDAATAWQARHHVEAIPYLGFYDAGGRELARIDTYVDADELLLRAPPAP